MENRWIEDRLNELGSKKIDLAERLGLAPSRITEIIRGERLVKVKEMPVLAHFLNMRPVEVFEHLSGTARGVRMSGDHLPILGTVEAGCWQKKLMWDKEHPDTVSLPIPQKYKACRVFALSVKGDSMDLVYPDGSIVLCVSVCDIDREPSAGERVIVQRTNKDGEIETTVKELVQDKSNRRFLVPRTTSPEHQSPLEIEADNSETVEVLAVVVASFQIETQSA